MLMERRWQEKPVVVAAAMHMTGLAVLLVIQSGGEAVGGFAIVVGFPFFLFYLPVFIVEKFLSALFGQLLDLSDSQEYFFVTLPSIVCLGAIQWYAVASHFLERRYRARVGGCRGCGYDLTGNVSGRCPECGERV